MNQPPEVHDLEDLIVREETTILDTMKVIDKVGLEIALVCGERKKLLAIVTDGDIRRALIQGKTLNHKIGEVGNRKFTSVKVGCSREQAIALMVKNGFKHIPVLDEKDCLVDLHTLQTSLMGDRIENWAVIMAGGKGERLGDITKSIPKPMLPIGNKPILEHIIQNLVRHGIRRVFLSVNYFEEMIHNHFFDGHAPDGRSYFCKIEYLREPQDCPLGTGGPLSLLPELPKHPLVVMNGDLLTNIHIGRMLAFHRSGDYIATMGLREHIVQVPFGVAEVKESKIVKLVEKPKLNYRINAGIYVLNPELIPTIPKGRMYPITDLLNGCLKDGKRVGAYNMQEVWNDIGLPEEYQRAQQG